MTVARIRSWPLPFLSLTLHDTVIMCFHESEAFAYHFVSKTAHISQELPSRT